MKGGYQIIDLTNIDIVLGSDAVTITDNQVLKELLTLRDYIEDDYDYSKPLNRKLKPILLRLRDEKEDEEIEASLWANLSIIDDNLSFKIEGIINGKTITINTVFEKLQDDNGNDYYAIDEANYLLTNQQPIFENIVDKDGHARFIEDNNENGTITGVTINYNKWSLSGSHLLIVVAGNVTNGSVFSGQLVTDISLPQWIKDKIFTIYGNVVDYKAFVMLNSGGGAQTTYAYLYKVSTTKMRIDVSSITLTDDRAFRIAFDLLIDNE